MWEKATLFSLSGQFVVVHTVYHETIADSLREDEACKWFFDFQKLYWMITVSVDLERLLVLREWCMMDKFCFRY